MAELDAREFNFAKYLLELSLMEYGIVKWKNSHIAASVVYLVMKIFQAKSSSASVSSPKSNRRYKEWSTDLESDSGYSLSEVRECGKDLYIMLYKTDMSNLNAVRRKFSSKKYQEVSKYRIEFRK